jgi:ATP-dependent protease Clp ATPase subunit
MDILRSNVIDRLTREFEDEGFELVIEDDVLNHVINEGLQRETGARGLSSILTRHLENAAFDSFAESGGGEIRVRLDQGAIRVDVKE